MLWHRQEVRYEEGMDNQFKNPGGSRNDGYGNFMDGRKSNRRDREQGPGYLPAVPYLLCHFHHKAGELGRTYCFTDGAGWNISACADGRNPLSFTGEGHTQACRLLKVITDTPQNVCKVFTTNTKITHKSKVICKP